MRIAIYHNLPSGGAKRTLYEETRRLAMKNEVDVFTLSCADHGFADLRPVVANHFLFDFQPLSLFRSPFGRLNQVIRLLDLRRLGALSRSISSRIEAGQYDVVLVHPCQFENSPGILYYTRKVPTAFYCHEPLRLLYEPMPDRPYEQPQSGFRSTLDKIDPLPGLYRRVLKQADRRNLKSAGMVLVNSQFIRQSVAQIYQVDARVCYHGVDIDQFKPLSLKKQRMVLSVGSLTPLKGFDFLIQALAEIPSDERPRLVIASNFQNQPEKMYLSGLARDKGVNIEMMARIDDNKLVELYNQALLTLYAPVREPFGLVPLESMACGTPVIGVREGGIQETILHEHTGLLVERDRQKFASAIQILIADSTNLNTMGVNSRKYVLDRWTWGRAVESLENDLLAARDLKFI